MRTVAIVRSCVLALMLLVCSSALLAQPATPVEHRYARLFVDNPARVPTVDSALNRTRIKLVDLLRDTMDYRPDLYVTGDPDEFKRLIGSKFPDWGAAAAIPTMRRIVIKSPDQLVIEKSLQELVAHEYAHLALADRLGIRSAPRWLDEGIAMYTSAEWGWSENLAMSKAAVFRQFVKLSDIDLVNRFNAGKAQVAYAQSYLGVKYFVDQYGVNALNILLDNLASGQPLDTALLRSTGSVEADFEKEFHAYLTQRYNVTSFFMDTIWLWILLAFVVVIGGFLKFRKRREYYRKWEEQERYESTDFQYGSGKAEDPDPDEDDEPWRR